MSAWDKLGSPAAQRLAAQMTSDAVAHAWILLGPRGAGKRQAALAMAAAMNCPAEPRKGCGDCSTCMRIWRARHPDVRHIVPEGPLIPVDVIRDQIIPEAARSPFESPHKVFILEEAERMNPAAQNALLKTLEEPQPDTVFVLIAEQEEELLETIRSRCRTFRLDAVPEERVVQVLVQEGVTEDIALLAARASGGDVDRARALASGDAAAQRRAVWLSVPRKLSFPVAALDAAQEILEEVRLGMADLQAAHKQEVIDLAEAMGEGRGTAAARNALAKRHKRELRRLEEELIGEALDTIASFYRDVLALRRGAAEAVTSLDRMEEISRWAASSVSDAALLEAADRCIRARGDLPLNANQQLLVESVLLEIARLCPAESAVGARVG